MRLYEIPPDPEPTPAQLKPFLAEWVSAPKALRAAGARLSWYGDRQRRDPDLFLVPFVSWLTPIWPGFDYNDYRKSPTWRAIRGEVLQTTNSRCVGCGGRATQVHHRDYRPRVLRGDDLRPLVPVCRACHDTVEDARQKDGWHAGERVLRELAERVV